MPPPADAAGAARAAMVDFLRSRVSNPRVLGAFARVPRERFIAPALRGRAYEDSPLPIGFGQTISQPLMVALMLDVLALQGHERVLDVGTGSGYQAALLSLLAAEVVSVERIQPLAQQAAERLALLGYSNVSVRVTGQTVGWPDAAPYDAIVCAAAAPDVPEGLLRQLAVGGRMVIPVGTRLQQELALLEMAPDGARVSKRGACRFVPLLGEGGFDGHEPPDAPESALDRKRPGTPKLT